MAGLKAGAPREKHVREMCTAKKRRQAAALQDLPERDQRASSSDLWLQQSPGGMGLPCGHVVGWAQERADALVEFRADDVLELARLGMRLVIVNPEGVLEQSFRQAVTPYQRRARGSRHVRQLHS